MAPGAYSTLNEIVTQTSAWSEAIRVVDLKAKELQALDLRGYRQILCTGCGSTYYLALSAASLLQSSTGAVVRAMPASELLLFPEAGYSEGRTLLVAISRSGATSETIQAAHDFKKHRRGEIIVITNYGDSPLALQADLLLSIESGREASVAQTRSFASMLVAASALSAWWGSGTGLTPYEGALVSGGRRLIEERQELARDLAEDRRIGQVFFLGSGPRYGLACEASLKLKEMSQTVCEPFHFLEFRHGPISMVDKQTLVVGMVSEKARQHETLVLEDARQAGAKILSLGEEGTDIEWKTGIPEIARNVLYMPFLQLLAYHRAVSRGKNPDIPRHLAPVVKLDLSPRRRDPS